ncbi:MAG: ATP synthase F1 subunit delta [Lachnospiraceae bacterium]|nr:ATP synthase F1 subunit delta [Lachnospiraceae bacterium]
MADKIVRVYAGAVFDSAYSAGKLEEIYAQSGKMYELLSDNPDLLRILVHPDIQIEEKEGIIERTFKGRVMDELYGLMLLLLEKGRIGHIEDILSGIISLCKEAKGIGEVYVKTPIEMKASQKEALKKKLLSDTKYTSLEFHFGIDESLLSGMVIRIGDRVVDSSAATRLKNMTRQLKMLQIK